MVKKHLIDWMPEYYAGENTKAIQEVREVELGAAGEKQERIIGDMYVSSAKDIGLWEDEYGVKNSSTSLIQRQQNMLAYIRGGGGAVTRETILAVVNSYTGTDSSEVIELPDENTIRIVCHLSAESVFDRDDLVETLNKLIQAHVGVYIDGSWNYEATGHVRYGFKCIGSYRVNPTIRT